MSEPIAAVFNTPELLEMIPLRTARRDTYDAYNVKMLMKRVLRSQRVSKTFQALIKTSPRIQEFLFFRPQTRLMAGQTLLAHPSRRYATSRRYFNQLLRDRTILIDSIGSIIAITSQTEGRLSIQHTRAKRQPGMSRRWLARYAPRATAAPAFDLVREQRLEHSLQGLVREDGVQG